jgi:hypothetical protein
MATAMVGQTDRCPLRGDRVSQALIFLLPRVPVKSITYASAIGRGRAISLMDFKRDLRVVQESLRKGESYGS